MKFKVGDEVIFNKEYIESKIYLNDNFKIWYDENKNKVFKIKKIYIDEIYLENVENLYWYFSEKHLKSTLQLKIKGIIEEIQKDQEFPGL